MNRRNIWMVGGLLAALGLLTLAWVRGGDRVTRLIEEPVAIPRAGQG